MRSAEGRPELRKDEVVKGVVPVLDAGGPCADHEADELPEFEEREGRRVGTKRPIEGGAPEKGTRECEIRSVLCVMDSVTQKGWCEMRE